MMNNIKKINILLSFILFCLLSKVSMAQKDTLYFNKYWKVASKQNFDYYRVYEKNKGSFIIKDYFKSGQIQMTTNSKNYSELNKNGLTTFYYSNGEKESQGNYHKNEKDGLWLEWNDNGKIKSKGEYVEGKRNGFWKMYSKEGQLSREGEFKDGVRIKKWTYYHENGSIEEKGSYNEGNRIGNWEGFHENGEKEYFENYDDESEIDGLAQYWHDNKQLLVQKTYKKGIQISGGKSFHSNGNKNVIFDYNEEGEKIGDWTQFYESGDLRVSGSYKKSDKVGEWSEYYEGNVIKNKGVYKKGLKVDVWNYYHFNGKKSAVIEYKKDEIISEKYFDQNGDKSEKIIAVSEPSFISDKSTLEEFINLNLNIPNDSVKQGKVIVGFAILSDGSISDVESVESISPFIDESIVEFFKELPKFNSGKFLGRSEKYYLDVEVFLNANNTIEIKEYYTISNKYFNDIDIRNERDRGTIYTIVEEMPKYPGGNQEMFKFLGQNVRYPPAAKANGVSGKVYVNFVVRRTGLITEVRIIRGVHNLLDNEALRVVNMFPLWTEGRQRGFPVNVSYNLPINFRLR